MTMRELTLWLASLPLSSVLRRSSWAIPAMQTAHILSIGLLLSSIVMIDLRIWGYSRSSTLVESGRRFLPWIWTSLVLLTVTGVLLTIAEPRRVLNGVFQIKLALMVVAIVVTVPFHWALGRYAAVWDANAGARWKAGSFAGLILFLWAADTVAGRGRWISGLLGF
jgi:hypothetical protein